MTKKTGNRSSAAKWRGYAANVLVLVIIVAGIRWWQHRDMVSGAAPALQGVTLAGQPYTLAARPGKPVLVHFWATWCPICRMGQGGIDAIARDHLVVTVAMQSGDAQEIRAYLAKQGVGFPVLLDPDGALSSAWGVPAVPASFVVDAAGRIRFATVGYTTEAGLRARLWAADQIE